MDILNIVSAIKKMSVKKIKLYQEIRVGTLSMKNIMNELHFL